jgi:MFS family permease
MTDEGLSETSAVLVLSTIAVAGAAGSLFWGYFAEKIRSHRLLAINAFVNGLVFLLLFWAVKFRFPDILRIGAIFFLAAIHGTLHGGRLALLPIIWADFFGRQSLGSIYGFSSPFYLTGNATGPIFTAFFFDVYLSYTFPFYLFAFLYIVSGLISIYMKPPRFPAQAPISQV